MSIGIDIEHPVAHVHTQNGLAESFIKCIKLIARPLLMRCKLPISTWGHAILHAAKLIRIRPTSYHDSSPLKLVLVKNLIFPIYEYLDVRCMFQFLHHNALRWFLKEGWEYTLDMNLHLLLPPSLNNSRLMIVHDY